MTTTFTQSDHPELYVFYVCALRILHEYSSNQLICYTLHQAESGLVSAIRFRGSFVLVAISNQDQKSMTSQEKRVAFAARLLAFGASEVKYVGGLRDQMTEDFVTFVRGAKDDATKQDGLRMMTMSLQKNDLAAQVDQHVLSLMSFATDLLRDVPPSEERPIIELVQEVAATWTLGDFRERFSRAFKVELGTANIGSLRNSAKEDIELF